MNGLNFHHLRYFHTVAHEGNLTRAAERLNVSQSSVSTQIRQLEERLGQPLFERRGRSLFLTEAGRIALDHADSIFAAGEELLNTLGERPSGRRQVLRVDRLRPSRETSRSAFCVRCSGATMSRSLSGLARSAICSRTWKRTTSM
jgi:DNA-binding MarR family transcriptional regulator